MTKKTAKRRTKEQIKTEISPIALFVRNRREELGHTQEDLAFRAGLNTRFIPAKPSAKLSIDIPPSLKTINSRYFKPFFFPFG